MSPSSLILFAVVLGMAAAFALTNGFLGGASLASTVILTRVMEAPAALILVAVCEVLGVLLLGQAVSHTMAYRVLVIPEAAGTFDILAVLTAALFGALLWNVGMWRLALPSSSSHALIGGLLGASLAAGGLWGVHWSMIVRIFLLLAVVPLAGAAASYLLSLATQWLGQFITPAAGGAFRTLQILALSGLSMVHGSNDGQKSIGMIWLALAALHGSTAISKGAMYAVALLVGLSMAFGMVFGSRRIISTVGHRLCRVQSLESFCAQLSAMVLMGMSSWWGYPMSTTQVASTTVMGAGAATHLRGVRWSVAQDIVIAWLITIPAAALLSAGVIRLIYEVRYVVS